jgi:hypothetical protein
MIPQRDVGENARYPPRGRGFMISVMFATSQRTRKAEDRMARRTASPKKGNDEGNGD